MTTLPEHTPPPAPVRLALPHEREAIFNLMLEAYADNGRGNVSHHKLMSVIDRTLGRQGGLMGVIEEDGKLVALVALCLSQYCYTDDWHIEELINYVHRDYRRSTHAKSLIRFAKWTADYLNVELLMGIISHERVEAKIRLYEREMTLTGAIFRYTPMGLIVRAA